MHLIPHLAPTVLVWATLGISTTVLLEATLSFLGVGVQPPTPSWGNIIFESQSYFTSAPWLVFFPGAAIVLLSLSFNIAGDALRDALDPGLKGRNSMLFLGKRLLHAGLILLGVTLICYLLLFMLPADPARQIAGRSATPEVVENIRHQLGLDLPFYQQYWRYLQGLLHGDLGRSFIQRSEVSELVSARIGPSLQLMAAGILCELVLGIALGTLAALKRGGLADRLLMALSFIGVSAPQFIAAMLFLYLFAVVLNWFPMGGYGGFSHLALPALTLGLLGSGWYSRMLRSSMIEVLHQDFIRTARAKGLGRTRVLLRHVLPNAVLPLIPMIGIDIGIFMGGLVVVESVFGWPGIGQLAWQAIQQVDIPVIVGVTTVSAVAIVGGNLIADLVLPWVDPRIDVKKVAGEDDEKCVIDNGGGRGLFLLWRAG